MASRIRVRYSVAELVVFFVSLVFGCQAQSYDPPQPSELNSVIDRMESMFASERVQAVRRLIRAQEIQLNEYKKNPRFLAALKRGIKDSDSVARMFFALVLARMGEATKELSEFYSVQILDKDYWVRIQVCAGVKQNKALLDLSGEILERALKDGHPSVVNEAASAVRCYSGLDNERIINLLILNIKNGMDDAVRLYYCVRALENVTKEKAKSLVGTIEGLKVEVKTKHGKKSDVYTIFDQTVESLKAKIK